ncbi:hypothetical protein [Microterricola viridarii]|nr:hypothetical protein [Microterricola viridarii]
MAKSDYLGMASTLGAQLKNMGIPMESVAKQTDDLVGLGADLAATFGGTTADAVGALGSLLRGESNPIERYGVSINAAAIKARMAADGLGDLSGEAETAAKTQTILKILAEQTADSVGQFGREADTAAGRTQIADAKWGDAAATLGEVLLPIIVLAGTALGDMAGWMSENSTTATILIGIVAGLAAGVLVLNGAARTYLAAQALLNSAFAVGTVAKVKDLAATVALKAMYAVDMVKALGWFLVQKGLELTAWGASLIAKGKDLAISLLLNAMYGVDMVKALGLFLLQKGLELAAWTAGTAAKVKDTAANVLSKTAIVAGTVAMGVATAAQWAWNVAMTANPIGLIIAAIVALIAVIVLIVVNFKTISRVAGEVWQNVINWVKAAIQWLGLGPTVKAIGDWFQWLGASAAGVWNWIIGGIKNVASWLTNGIVNTLSAVGSWFNWLGATAAGVWSWVTSGIDGIIGALSTAIDWVRSFASSIADGVGGWISNIFGWGGADLTMSVMHAALGVDASGGPDGTGGWPTWAASSSSSTTSSATTIDVKVSGTDQPTKTASKIVEALDEYFRRNGQLPAGGVSWQP